MTTKKTKHQKPIDLDVHFKFRCVKSSCGYEHWISLKEAQTKNYKIVCDCGKILRPKRISKVKILYARDESHAAPATQQKIVPIKADAIDSVPVASVDMLAKCGKVLVGFGFTQAEARILTNRAYRDFQTEDASALIKCILSNLEQLKNEFN